MRFNKLGKICRALAICAVLVVSMGSWAVIEAAKDKWSVGQKIIVQIVDLPLYAQADEKSSVITRLPQDSVLELIYGPTQIDGITWWYVKSGYGWIQESHNRNPSFIAFVPAQLDTIIDASTQALEQDSQDTNAYFKRALAYFNQQRYNEALGDLTQAIEIEPYYVPFYMLRGKVYLDAKDYSNALGDLGVVVSSPLSDATHWNRLGIAYDATGKAQNAIDSYLQGIEAAPDWGLIYSNLGNVYDNDFATRERYYQQAIQVAPYEVNGYYNLAQDYRKSGYMQAALPLYSRVLELNPNYAEAYLNRGVVYSQLGQRDLAQQDYLRVIELQPDNAEAYCNLGINLYYDGDIFSAQDYFEQSIQLNPNLYCGYYNMGIIYYELYQIDESTASYTKAIETNPDYYPAIYNRGRVYYDQYDFEKAIEDFTQALRVNPSFTRALLWRGNAYDQLGETDKAIADYNATLAIDPTEHLAYYNRAIAYVHLGNDDRAKADYEKSIQLEPTYANAYWGLGGIYEREEDLVQALENYKLYMRFSADPDPAVVYIAEQIEEKLKTPTP